MHARAQLTKSADLQDLALGVTAVLMHTHAPEPLALQFKCESPRAIGRLVDLIIDECADAGFELTAVFVPANVVVGLRRQVSAPGVPVEAKSELRDEVLFFRRAVRAA